jgi:hypothetical protein
MFVFACPIIAEISVGYFPSGQISVFALRANGKYSYLPSNICICPHMSVFAPEFNFRYLRSGLKGYMLKYKER